MLQLNWFKDVNITYLYHNISLQKQFILHASITLNRKLKKVVINILTLIYKKPPFLSNMCIQQPWF